MHDFLNDIPIQPLPHFSLKGIPVSILRLDTIHPIVSGNKWFKLKYYLQDAIQKKKKPIATFGGPYSNHIVASAFAAKQAGLQSEGYINGKELLVLNETLAQAQSYGMKLQFIGRSESPAAIIEKYNNDKVYWILPGGYGNLGVKGASDIMKIESVARYTHIICATGTGTMMAGLILGAYPKQQVLGISVLKNHFSIESEVNSLLKGTSFSTQFHFIHGYHFGGYAKHPPELIQHMIHYWQQWLLPTDIVYTSKLVYAVGDLLQKEHFSLDSNILLIHSGGLQGNRSLPDGSLPF